MIIFLQGGIAAAQYDHYYLIYGNRDGTPVRARLGSTLAIQAWGATDPVNQDDSINFMHMPLATSDTVITARLGGYFPDTLVGRWDQRSFLTPDSADPQSGYSNQSMLGFAELYPPFESQNFFFTNGDTVLICTYLMTTTSDPAFADTIVCPFTEGDHPLDGRTIWGVGIPEYQPLITFSCIQFVTCQTAAGDANSDAVFNGLDIVYSMNYLKGIGPAPLCVQDCPPFGLVMMAADANGDCTYNGIDISYGINNLKWSGPPPIRCADCQSFGSIPSAR